jgi:quercetin dioxygenase-like cupin family protein
MARPHIEFVNQDRLEWQTRSAPGDDVPIRFRTLSVDDGTGAFTRVGRPPAEGVATLQAPTTQELFVLEGRLTVGEYELGPREYRRLPGGHTHPVSGTESCRMLWTSDGTRDGTDEDDGPRFWAAEESGPTHVDPATMDWERADLPGTEPGLFLKRLYEDPDSGATTTLVKADWDDPRQKHHDCAEEVYGLDGAIRLGERGVLRAGDYVWRPPYVRHGGPERVESAPFLAVIRCDGPQDYHYMSADGVPLNY